MDGRRRTKNGGRWLAVQSPGDDLHGSLGLELQGSGRQLDHDVPAQLKGAYWDAEIKRAQELGLPHYPVFTHKHHTDVSYLACAQALLAAPDAIYPQFAGHNAGTIAAILQMAAKCAAPWPPSQLAPAGGSDLREAASALGRSSSCSACTAWARASSARC